jgi:UDP-N-acetylmuramoyl-tripeptide--D-alanyl-D-alanine ligase
VNDILHIYKLFLKHPHVITDSRAVKKDDIFFALKGDDFDGNRFIPNALAAGAGYAICDNQELANNKQVIYVPDVLKALQQLAQYHRRQLGIPILAITGSNGKTTTKELVSRVLAKKYCVSVTKGNLNNHIGVPLSLLEMNKDTQFGIIEMGTNHFGEITALCEIAQPNYGLITNVGKAHLEFLGSLEGVEKAKGELYEYLSASNGIPFYNSDNPILAKMIGERAFKEVVAYSRKKIGASIIPSDNNNPFLHFSLNSKTVNTHLIGSYNLDNAIAALTLAKCFGVEEDDAITAIESYHPDNNRSQLVNTGKNLTILDAYNANPSSMEAAILNFSEQQLNNKLLILGDMLELGENSKREHQHILELVKNKNFSNVFLAGKAFREANSNNDFISFTTTDELCLYLKEHELKRYSILVKGSRGIRLEKILDFI